MMDTTSPVIPPPNQGGDASDSVADLVPIAADLAHSSDHNDEPANQHDSVGNQRDTDSRSHKLAKEHKENDGHTDCDRRVEDIATDEG